MVKSRTHLRMIQSWISSDSLLIAKKEGRSELSDRPLFFIVNSLHPKAHQQLLVVHG